MTLKVLVERILAGLSHGVVIWGSGQQAKHDDLCGIAAEQCI